MTSYECRSWVRGMGLKAIWNGPAWWRSARGSCHVRAKRWPKPMASNLGDPVGCMPLHLASKGKRQCEPIGRGHICLHQAMRIVKRNAPKGRRARPSAPWLALVRASVESDLVWGGYINSSKRGKSMPKEGTNKIEREVNDFHSEQMKSSLQYWAQASLRYPIVTQATRKYLCIPASSATSERSFSKLGHIVRARRARLSDKHVKELSFLS